MKETKWVNPNKMKFESGHKTFDNQTNLITTGNINANTVMGKFIRPATEIECFGRTSAVGYLRDHDLQSFSHLNTPPNVMNRILELTETETRILYAFFHYDKRYKPILHGLVITDSSYRYITHWVTGRTYKSALVVNEAMQYVCNKTGEDNSGQE